VTSCEILTESVLRAALRGQLPSEQRAVLVRHLREPCESCLDLLQGWTPEEMMSSLHGPGDLLSPEEQQRVFSVASSAAASARPSGSRLAPPGRRRMPLLAWGAAAGLAFAVLVTVVRPDHPGGSLGLKGAPVPSIVLVPLVGARNPTPHIVRALAPGARLARGELLLLRIRLDAPAWVYLLSQKQGKAAELLWPLQPAARHSAGEFELAESGSALAVDPQALGAGGHLLVVASPEPIAQPRLHVREPVHTRAELEKTFPGCGVDVLPILVEAN
jgi:hypothetical protein